MYLFWHNQIYMITNFIYLTLLVTCTFTFYFKKDIQAPVEQPVRMPSYLGTGYDLMRGNPFTDHIDEGFRAHIF